MGTLFRFLDESTDGKRLLLWWESLDRNRGDRARLRRAQRLDDVLLTAPFFQFLQQMPEKWANTEYLLSSAIVAAALSHVKKPREGETFATQLALPKAGGKKARMSELRFQQLQKSRDPDEFFRRLLRAIRLLENEVNILSLTESILHWMSEYRYGVNKEPQKRLSIRWATEYYEQALENNP
jgi:CRISPR system Cascade subunit CasB